MSGVQLKGSALAIRPTILRARLAAVLFFWPGYSVAEPGFRLPIPIDPMERSPDRSGASSIGTATMLADGTILLQLRAEGRGSIGDALLRYPPSDVRYQAVRDHLPELRPGATVPVTPFP